MTDNGPPRRAAHVDFQTDYESVLAAYRLPNDSDGRITAERFYGGPRQPSPEEELLLAVLWQTLTDLQRHERGMALVNREDALRWLNDDDGRPFGFVWICEALALDAGYLRAGLLKAGGKG